MFWRARLARNTLIDHGLSSGWLRATWVRTVVRDALHASRSEELDAAVAAPRR